MHSLDSGHVGSRWQAETGGLGASRVLVSFRAALLTGWETQVILTEAGWIKHLCRHHSSLGPAAHGNPGSSLVWARGFRVPEPWELLVRWGCWGCCRQQVAHQARRLPSSAGRQWRKQRPWRTERWCSLASVPVAGGRHHWGGWSAGGGGAGEATLAPKRNPGTEKQNT